MEVTQDRKVKSLVIAPFDDAANQVRDTLYRALEELGVEIITPDRSTVPAKAIESSSFIIADITRQDPNVMYELGFAHALRVPTLLIMNEKAGSKLPSDLDGYYFIVYDPADLGSLDYYIRRAANRLIAEVRGE